MYSILYELHKYIKTVKNIQRQPLVITATGFYSLDTLPSPNRQKHTIFSGWHGATENARHKNTGRSKMQDLKMRDMNLRHQFARVEIAGHENAGPICRGGKCGKS